jgi:hypothetical protein
MERRWRRSCLRALTALGSLVLTLLLVELAFRHLAPIRSDGFSATLGGHAWFREHWKPINSHGLRDREHSQDELASNKVAFVVGDSFAAGHGIESIDDRFGEVLGRKLGAGWTTVNVADCGWATDDELKAVVGLGIEPDLIVLEWYVNDIEGAVARLALPPPQSKLRIRNFLLPLAQRSYAFDYVYWRLWKYANQDIFEEYWRSLLALYDDPRVWPEHQRDLDAFAGWARDRGIPLVVVVFPHLRDIPRSAPVTAKVAAYLRSRGATVIDLAPILAGRDPLSLVVNGQDPHASVALHAEIGELISAEVKKLDIKMRKR